MSHERVMFDANDEATRVFSHPRTATMEQSFRPLYPTHNEYERTDVRIIPIVDTRGSYPDERIMKHANGKLFWCHVIGHALDRVKPLSEGIWTFKDLPTHRPVTVALMPCERDIATQLVEGRASKQVGKQSRTSPRTIEIYYARLMRKCAANTSPELMQWLMGC